MTGKSLHEEHSLVLLLQPECSTTPSTLRVRWVLGLRETCCPVAGSGGDRASCKGRQEELVNQSVITTTVKPTIKDSPKEDYLKVPLYSSP